MMQHLPWRPYEFQGDYDIHSISSTHKCVLHLLTKLIMPPCSLHSYCLYLVLYKQLNVTFNHQTLNKNRRGSCKRGNDSFNIVILPTCHHKMEIGGRMMVDIFNTLQYFLSLIIFARAFVQGVDNDEDCIVSGENGKES